MMMSLTDAMLKSKELEAAAFLALAKYGHDSQEFKNAKSAHIDFNPFMDDQTTLGQQRIEK